MLKISKITLLFIGLSLMLLTCSDDDGKKKPESQIEVDGKTLIFKKGYIRSQQVIDGDGDAVGSAHWVYLTGGDLIMENNGDMTGKGPFLAMYIGSEGGDDLAPGEYDMELLELYFGNVAFFSLYNNYSLLKENGAVIEKYDDWYTGYKKGIVTVSKAGDEFTFKIALGEYFYLGSDINEVQVEVSEDVIGSFTGKLEVLVDEAPARKHFMPGKTFMPKK